MSEPTVSRRTRVSRSRVRLWAWTAGALSFLSPWLLLAVSPKPAQGETQSSSAISPRSLARPVVVVVTKKIIYDSAPSSTSSGGTGPIHYVYPSPASSAPVALSCGTHPC